MTRGILSARPAILTTSTGACSTAGATWWSWSRWPATEVVVQPLCGDSFELAEQIDLGLFAGIMPLCIEQSLRQVEEQCRAAQIARVNEGQIHALADDALAAGI